MQAKLDKLLKTYDECVKRGKYDPLDEVFDITKESGAWLCSEDRWLYHLQIESRGQVGYATGKAASSKTIHPSKRRKITVESTSKTATELSSSESEPETGSEYQESDNSEDQSTSARKKYCKTKTATKLVTSSKLSNSKAATVCQQLSQCGIDVGTPSQSGIYRSTSKEAKKLKEEMKKNTELRKLVTAFRW